MLSSRTQATHDMNQYGYHTNLVTLATLPASVLIHIVSFLPPTAWGGARICHSLRDAVKAKVATPYGLRQLLERMGEESSPLLFDGQITADVGRLARHFSFSDGRDLISEELVHLSGGKQGYYRHVAAVPFCQFTLEILKDLYPLMLRTFRPTKQQVRIETHRPRVLDSSHNSDRLLSL